MDRIQYKHGESFMESLGIQHDRGLEIIRAVDDTLRDSSGMMKSKAIESIDKQFKNDNEFILAILMLGMRFGNMEMLQKVADAHMLAEAISGIMGGHNS